MSNRTIAALAAAVALIASATACTGNTVQEPAPAPSQSAQAPTPPDPAPASVAKFGGAVTFPDGVKVSVSQPTAVTAGQFAYGAVERKIVTFNLTVTNGSKRSINAALMGTPRVTWGAEGSSAQFAADADQKIGTSFLSTVLPGESQTVKVGYGVPAAGFSDVRVEVFAPSLTDQPAVFKGVVK